MSPHNFAIAIVIAIAIAVVSLMLSLKYQYCGPGTKLAKRLERNDPGKNPLDRACREHDIAYEKTTNTKDRNKFDDIIANQAWKRVKSSNASLGERATALGVTGVMKLKSKLGMGLTNKKQRAPRAVAKKVNRKSQPIAKVRGKGLTKQKKPSKPQLSATEIKEQLRQAIQNAKQRIKLNNPTTFNDATKTALAAAKQAITKKIPKRNITDKLPRVIPIPKVGGVLPLIPIFAGLSALGALMGGSAGVANAVITANSVKNRLKEAQRHNETMEAIALGRPVRTGNGLFLTQHKKGYGLFVKNYQNNKQQSKN